MPTPSPTAWTGNVSLSYNVAGGNGSFSFKPLGTTDLIQQLRAQIPPSFDYYVSSLNGNDANDGLTPATAKQTIAAAQNLLGAGKSLGLEYGSYFREQLTIDYPNVRVGAYGVGELPVLDASKLVQPEDILKTPGYTNLYQFDVTPVADIDGREFLFSTFEDGQRLRRIETTKEDCDNTPGSFYAPQSTSTSVVYFHAIDSVNPKADGVTIEVAVRDAGFDTADAATGLRLSNIHAKRSILNDGVLRIRGKKSVVSACVAEDGTKHTLYVTDDCSLEDVVCWKGEGRDSYFIYYYENATGDSKGTTFRRCVAIGGYAYGQQVARYETASGYYCHSFNGAANPLANVLYEDCYAENFGTGFAGEALQLTVRGCFTHLTAIAAAGPFKAGAAATIERNFFDQRAGGDYQKASNEQRTLLQATAGTTTIRNNVLLTAIPDTKYGFCLYASNGDVVFTRNTLLNEGNGNGLGISKQGAGQLTFDHNIFYDIREICNVNNSALSSFNNVYWRPNSGPIAWTLNGTPYTSLFDWQNQTTPKQDAGSISADPDFFPPSTFWHTVGIATPRNPTVIALGAGATS